MLNFVIVLRSFFLFCFFLLFFVLDTFRVLPEQDIGAIALDRCCPNARPKNEEEKQNDKEKTQLAVEKQLHKQKVNVGKI